LLYLNDEEVDWCKQLGIKIIVAINGVASFSNGMQKSQKIYFNTLQKCDYYLIPHAPHLDALKSFGINAHEMPFFYSESIYRPLKNHHKLWNFFEKDLFFIGNIGDLSINQQGQYRKDLLSNLAKNFNVKVMSDLKNYGHKVTRKKPTFNENIINWHQNTAKMILCMDYFPDINTMYQDFNNNIIQPYNLNYYYFIRPRTFYSMGSGVPVISEKHPEIERFFSDGENIILWEKDDLFDKINYYLNHQDKLEKIGASGLETVRTFHTLDKRMNEVIMPALLGSL
jgi:spore maturation protein CgeB